MSEKVVAPNLFSVFKSESRLRNYSPKTINAYLNCLQSFVRQFAPRHPHELNEQGIKNYSRFSVLE